MISLFLTALGLFGLAWYSVESRMKEIGLRKINGATQRQVVGLLCIRLSSGSLSRWRSDYRWRYT